MAEIRKIIVYMAGVATALVALGLLSGPALTVALVIIAVATGGGIYQLPNRPRATE